MENQTPLFLVILTIIALWLLSKAIAKASSVHATPTAFNNIKANNTEIIPGLHVTGLSDKLIQEMHEIIERRDIDKLAYFFTKRCPELPILEDYFTSLRSQYFSLLGKPTNEASEAEKTTAINALNVENTPECVDINVISKVELQYLVEDNVKKYRVIDSELIKKFGDENFMENFKIYTQLTHGESVTLHIPTDHHHRTQVEALVDSGIAIRGRKIPLKDRLNVLKFSQLRDIATELKIDSQFKRKSEATETLAAMPGSAVHLAMVYDISDLFYLKAEPYVATSVEEEWAYFNAYAKLIIKTLAPI